MSLEEVKTKVDQLANAWEAFKQKSDEEIKEIKKKGAADPLITESLSKINGFMDETKGRLDQLDTAIARTHKGGDEGGEGKETAEQAEYKKAFLQYVRKGATAGLDAVIEKKALSVGSDPDGGYVVTPQMSQNVIKIVYETSPIRQVAAVETIASDALEILEDRGEVQSVWTAEMGTRSETTTSQLGKKSIPVHELYGYPKATQKLIDDASVNIEQWLTDKLAEAFSRNENTSFVTGSGVGQPRGLLTYAAGTNWGQIQQQASGTNGGFDGDDLIDVFYLLKDEYQRNASWMMNRQCEAVARKLKESTTGQYLWQPGLQAGAPNILLGRPVYQASDMPVPGTNSLSIAIGDFRRAYQIVDRAGIRIKRDDITAPGFVKFHAFKRVGGDVINFEALKLLKLGS